MYLNYLIIIVSLIICGVSSEMNTVEEMYLNFFVQIESVKKSIDILKVRLDAVSEKNRCDGCSLTEFGVVKQYFDDLNTRLDPLIDSSKNKQQYVDKQSFDDFKTQFEALTDNFKVKQQNVDSKMEKLESQHIQEISEMKGNYANLLDELNTVTLSEKRLKEKYNDLEEKYLELIKNKETESKSNNELNLRMEYITTQLKEKYNDLEEKYLELVKNKETESKSNNELNLHMDNITTQLSNIIAYEVYDKKPLFDVRIDQLPVLKKQHCQPDSEPTDCKSATKCTQKSGYYKIYLPGNKAKQVMVFCDMKIAGGNWMHILRRTDGSENFTRGWSDYVNGFGNVEGEYWIGLENLNALTNNNGRQLLYVYFEVSPGVSYYALYNDFVVGDTTEVYKLKTLGSYSGTAVDGMSFYYGQKFSTIDYDNDGSNTRHCAKEKNGGWWFNECGFAEPTGHYRKPEGIRWDSKESSVYYYKVMYFMIRAL